MPILLVFLALLAPRVVLVLLWFFTTWPHGLFHNLLWPVVGFILLPTTLLWYMIVQHWFGGHWTQVPEIGIVIALVIDLAPGGHRMWRR